MTTVEQAAADQIEDIETILRLMAKHDWTRLTITDAGFSLSGDDIGRSLVVGLRGEDDE